MSVRLGGLTQSRRFAYNSANMRIGAVNYLNSKPLVYGLERLVPEVRLYFDLPSRLADSLAAGRLDVALIPSVEFFRAPRMHDRFGCVRGVSRAGAEREAVFSRAAGRSAPRGARRGIAHERGSDADPAGGIVRRATAVGTAADRLRAGVDGCRCGAVDWRSSDCERGASRASQESEARSLGPRRRAGIEWTGLPFVFAMWVARPDVDAAEVAAVLAAARDQGVRHLRQIAEREAPALGISSELANTYLRDNLHFALGRKEREGLRQFYRLVRRARARAGRVGIVNWKRIADGCPAN